MGLTDIFTPEERVTLPVSSLLGLYETTANATAKALFMENAIKCRVPHEHIYAMLTGKPDTLAEYQETGLSPAEVSDCVADLAEARVELEKAKLEIEELRKELKPSSSEKATHNAVESAEEA